MTNENYELERGIQTIHLDEHQILGLVQMAFPNCYHIDAWSLLFGGALNTTYQFRIKNDSYVLRLYVRERSKCSMERAIHNLIDNSISTPKLIYANDSYKPWAFSIFEFISGIHITEVPNNDKISLSYELGSVLASIHAFKFSKAGLFGEGVAINHLFEIGSSPYFEECLSILSKGKKIRYRLGEQLIDQAITFIQDNKKLFPVIAKDNICLTHSDFKPVNLLYTSLRKVFVVDWEFAHAGVGILDFAVLLRHRNQFPLDINTLKSTYTNLGGVLPDEWLRVAHITDFVNMLTLMEESPSERPQLFLEFKSHIQTTIDQWDSI